MVVKNTRRFDFYVSNMSHQFQKSGKSHTYLECHKKKYISFSVASTSIFWISNFKTFECLSKFEFHAKYFFSYIILSGSKYSTIWKTISSLKTDRDIVKKPEITKIVTLMNRQICIRKVCTLCEYWSHNVSKKYFELQRRGLKS